jgi:hypothetical protein
MIRREHLEIARVFFALPESSGYGVGGGLAALVHDVIHRDTEDIDLFRDRRRAGVEPQRAAEALATAAEAHGWAVEWIHRYPDHARLGIATRHGSLLVDIALDFIERPLVTTALGPTLDERDVAVGKVVALFDRAEARDFVDVFAFCRQHDRDALLALALQRDPGLQPDQLAERLRRVTEDLGSAQFPASYRPHFDAIRAFFLDWRQALL